jgi:hypothetical protein
MGRPIVVTVGPLAGADDNGIAESQSPVGAQYLALNGALTDGSDADSVCQSQTPSGAGTLTIDGVLASSGVAYLGANARIDITTAGDVSNRTFTIVGTYLTPTGPVGQTEIITGPNTDVVASQLTYFTVTSITISGSAAGAVTVGRGGVATLDASRKVIVTSAGDDTGITFAISGTDGNGNTIGEVLAGASGAAAQSALSYKSVTSIRTSGATDDAIIVGTNTVADSQLVRFDDYAANAQVAIQATVDGTVNYTVQQTMDDPNWLYSGIAPADMTWVNHPDSALVNASSTAQGNYAYAPLFAKAVVNSGTGAVTVTFRQAYLG